jgi:Fic family protein
MRELEKATVWNDKKFLSKGIDLISNPDFQRTLKNINDKYLYWDKVKYIPNSGTSDPLILWSAVKLSRRFQTRHVQFGKTIFRYNLTDVIQRGLHEFDLNIGGTLGAGSVLPEEGKKRYLISSIMEEAIASSQIEGAVTTRKVAKEMLRKNIKPRNKSEQMIFNNFQTIKRIVEIKNERITIDKLLEIHRLIANQTLDDPDDEGRYRDSNDVNVVDVTDGEIVHTPPDFREVNSLMDELFHFFNTDDDSDFIHPIIKGCIIHFMIGYIHPFVDGNGRTARALFYWYLLSKGYWLTEYLSISRLIVKSKNQYAYSFLYSEIDENDLTYFIHYKVRTMQMAFSSLREYIQRKIDEKKQLINFQKIKGINERKALIIKWLYEESKLIFTVKEIENRFNVANQTARNDLIELVEMGYMDIIELNGKEKGFCRSSSFLEKLEVEFPKTNID